MTIFSTRTLRRRVFALLPVLLQDVLAGLYVRLKQRRAQRLETPTALIFFVTSRCNARCAHCFFWQELNRSAADELSLEEIGRVAASLSHPVHLSLTGGEPFLRDDLFDIARIFHEKNGCNNIGIATNGFLSPRVLSTCTGLATLPGLESLAVQVSLDGGAATHDAIRGVPGGFDRAMATIAALRELARQKPHFSVTVSITIQKQNIDEVESLVDLLLPRKVPIRFALVRGQNFGTFCLPPEVTSSIDPRESDAPMLDLPRLTALFARLAAKNAAAPYRFWSALQQEKIRLSLAMLEEKKRQLPCHAGRIDAVLYADGGVAMCELTKLVGNVRDFDCDFAKLWHSEKAEWTRARIQKCFCIHGCNLTTAMMLSPALVARSLREDE